MSEECDAEVPNAPVCNAAVHSESCTVKREYCYWLVKCKVVSSTKMASWQDATQERDADALFD